MSNDYYHVSRGLFWDLRISHPARSDENLEETKKQLFSFWTDEKINDLITELGFGVNQVSKAITRKVLLKSSFDFLTRPNDDFYIKATAKKVEAELKAEREEIEAAEERQSKSLAALERQAEREREDKARRAAIRAAALAAKRERKAKLVAIERAKKAAELERVAKQLAEEKAKNKAELPLIEKLFLDDRGLKQLINYFDFADKYKRALVKHFVLGVERSKIIEKENISEASLSMQIYAFARAIDDELAAKYDLKNNIPKLIASELQKIFNKAYQVDIKDLYLLSMVYLFGHKVKDLSGSGSVETRISNLKKIIDKSGLRRLELLAKLAKNHQYSKDTALAMKVYRAGDRDKKPIEFVINNDGRIKLADLGLNSSGKDRFIKLESLSIDQSAEHRDQDLLVPQQLTPPSRKTSTQTRRGPRGAARAELTSENIYQSLVDDGSLEYLNQRLTDIDLKPKRPHAKLNAEQRREIFRLRFGLENGQPMIRKEIAQQYGINVASLKKVVNLVKKRLRALNDEKLNQILDTLPSNIQRKSKLTAARGQIYQIVQDEIFKPKGNIRIFEPQLGSRAIAIETDNGFMVLRGSGAKAKVFKSARLSGAQKQARDELISTGILQKDPASEDYVFQRDVIFKSPSEAMLVMGYPPKPKFWREKEYKTIPVADNVGLKLRLETLLPNNQRKSSDNRTKKEIFYDWISLDRATHGISKDELAKKYNKSRDTINIAIRQITRLLGSQGKELVTMIDDLRTNSILLKLKDTLPLTVRLSVFGPSIEDMLSVPEFLELFMRDPDLVLMLKQQEKANPNSLVIQRLQQVFMSYLLAQQKAA